MFSFHKMAIKATTGGALALAIMAAPPVLTTYVDVGASAEAATWPEKKSKYKKEKEKKRFTPPSQSFGRKIDQLIKAEEAKDWKKYGEVLAGMRSRYDKYAPGEKVSFLWREIAYEFAQESIKSEQDPNYESDYSKIVGFYEKLLTFHTEMRESAIRQILSALAQMHMASSDFRTALKYYHEWLGMGQEIRPAEKFQIGQAHFFLKEYDLSLEWVEEAIADVKAKGELPKESWYRTQKGIYYEKKNPKKVAEILEILVTHFPKKRYWQELAVIFQQDLEKPVDSMVLLDTLFMQDQLTKAQFLKALAYGYNSNSAPYQMAKVYQYGLQKGYLEENPKHLKDLFFTLSQAGERKEGIKVLERYIKLDPNDVDMMNALSGEYTSVGSYQKAVDTARKAQKLKDQGRQPGLSHMREGEALFYLKSYAKAAKAFERASKHDKMKKNAQSWAAYVKSRIRELEATRKMEKDLKEELAKGVG
ncbi:hypothetical protein QSV34_13165 [Porticoccus sp. W117]|uniref:tetratricopeptide repeat protein n=1 Tax=Porticoccus sp. W117 TaxID=3054777 RepID=UPI002594744A|nr:hypothetical protein [Porticoccus sp. W117]MDM3872299.1 hypothetical protein [Porticoccus sp. W117]